MDVLQRRAPRDSVLVAQHARRRADLRSDHVHRSRAGSSTRATRRRFSIAGAASSSTCPSGVTLPALPGRDRDADERPPGGGDHQRLHARPGCARSREAGATVRDVQRMTLEEIFVATVMRSRKEAARDPSIVPRLVLKDLYLTRWIVLGSMAAGAVSLVLSRSAHDVLRGERRLHLRAGRAQHLPRHVRGGAGEEGQGRAVRAQPAGFDLAVHHREDRRQRHRLRRAVAAADGAAS